MSGLVWRHNYFMNFSTTTGLVKTFYQTGICQLRINNITRTAILAFFCVYLTVVVVVVELIKKTFMSFSLYYRFTNSQSQSICLNPFEKWIKFVYIKEVSWIFYTHKSVWTNLYIIRNQDVLLKLEMETLCGFHWS